MRRATPRRVTGTTFYTFPKCAHAVALDMFEDRDRRRPWTAVEEFVLKRGRDLEDRLTATLGYATPEYPDRDFDAGAAATLELLREGVPGVLQGVVLGAGKLGIPDLVRREAGASQLGEHHYVIGDIKSSGRGRGDQILQIMFYTRLLAAVQGRQPEYAYLVLRDGHEERFAYADYSAVLDDVEARIDELRGGAETRPFLSYACRGCGWSDVCLPELAAADDLSLLQGMTRGLRRTLEAAGPGSCAALQKLSIEPLARRTHIESAQLRRLKKAATARAQGSPVAEKSTKGGVPDNIAVVHLLADPFAERVHWIGVLHPAGARGKVLEAQPNSRDEELPAFLGLLEQLPARVPLWHYGTALPRWYDEVAWRERGTAEVERRMVDLARRLRGAASYPAPVFGLDGHVQQVLQRDPHRAGDAGAVGLWMEEPEASERLASKGGADLQDLLALIDTLREG